MFFKEQTVPSLIEGVHTFEQIEHTLNPKELRKHAESFGKEHFKQQFKQFVDEKLSLKQNV